MIVVIITQEPWNAEPQTRSPKIQDAASASHHWDVASSVGSYCICMHKSHASGP